MIKIKANQSYRWMINLDVYCFQDGGIYEVDETIANQMISAGVAKKSGMMDLKHVMPLKMEAEFEGNDAAEIENDDLKLENKMVDLSYKKRGRPRKEVIA